MARVVAGRQLHLWIGSAHPAIVDQWRRPDQATLSAREWVMDLIGVVDTMFARYDMGAEALDELSECPGYGTQFTTLRRTVPGFKDLAVAAKKMIEEDGCRIVVALGMPGREQVDKVCAHEASTGIMTAQLMTNTPILEVFVDEDESDDPAELAMVFRNRSARSRPQRLPDALRARPAHCPSGPGGSAGLRQRRPARGLARPPPAFSYYELSHFTENDDPSSSNCLAWPAWSRCPPW